MRSRRPKSDASSVSLFPFLAVLLCTMGSLIVILVVIARQVRADAVAAKRAEAKAAAAPQDETEQMDLEDAQWRVERLSTARDKTTEQLANQRLALAHVEEHMARLRAKLEQLDRSSLELERAGNISEAERRQAEADLEQLRHRIAELADELRNEKEDAAQRNPSYAIIPYEGASGTRRRPLYIECRSDAVILQPEGIRLGPQDFVPPLGPGNPLAAALRAAREYLVAQPGMSGEPYPLLLVRPSGITAYYLVREAIESWDADFGYELIGEDWKLKLPAADKRLAQVEAQAVENGRWYQRQLALAAPSQYRRRRATHRSGSEGSGRLAAGALGTGAGSDGETATAASGVAGADRPFSDGTGASSGDDSQRTSSNARNVGSDQSEKAGNDEGQSEGVAGGTQAEGGAQQSFGAPGFNGDGANSAGGASFSDHTAFDTANRRSGENWALPDAARGAFPIRRGVRVLCLADRFVLMSDEGLEGGRVVPLEGSTGDALEQFVSTLWEHMKGWGIAGNGLFWRPVLTLQIVSGGEQRARDLERLLHDSGVEIRTE